MMAAGHERPRLLEDIRRIAGSGPPRLRPLADALVELLSALALPDDDVAWPDPHAAERARRARKEVLVALVIQSGRPYAQQDYADLRDRLDVLAAVVHGATLGERARVHLDLADHHLREAHRHD